MKFAFLCLTAALTLAGCSHSMMRGSVAMKTHDQEAHVCLGNKEVKVGDRVNAFSNVCPSKGGGRVVDRGTEICEKRPLGAGMITELLNEHYSVVRFDEGVKFAEGTLVEKQR